MTLSTCRLVRASAGTGKTYRLVELYLTLVVEHGLAPEQIVAVTFTRAAAAELRRRIGQRLSQLGYSSATIYGLERAPIGTFHQLALAWLQGGSGAAWEVLEEPKADAALFAAAAEQAWLAADGEQLAHVVQVAGSCRYGLDRRVQEELFAALSRAQAAGWRLDDRVFGGPYRVPAEGGTALQAQAAALRARLVLAVQAGELKRERAVRIANEALAIATPAAFAEHAGWSQRWLSFLGALDLTSLGRVVARAERDSLLEQLSQWTAEAACYRLQKSWTAVALQAAAAYEAAKAARRAFDYTDLIAKLNDRLRDDSSFRQSVQAGVGAVLLDEAQDTDSLQREMVSLLLGGREGAASPHFVVVGDDKQCIYGFRGSDPHSFAALAHDIDGRGGETEVLAKSYRATPRLQAGLNALGSHLFAGAYEPVESAVSQEREAQGDGIVARRSPLASEAPFVGGSALAEEVARSLALVHALQAEGARWQDIAILCRNLQSTAPAFLRGFAAANVPLVICQEGQLFAQLEIRQWWSLLAWLAEPDNLLAMAVALRSPLVGLDDEVLTALLDPAGREAKAALALHGGDAGPLLASLQASGWPGEPAPLRRWAELFARGARLLRERPPMAALAALERLFGLKSFAMGTAARTQLLLHLEQLGALAQQEEACGQTSSVAFVLRLHQRMRLGQPVRASGVGPAQASAVTLSTVHGAKGLEWPIVILAQLNQKSANWGPSLAFDSTDGIVFAPEGLRGPLHTARWQAARSRREEAAEAEQRRLLYVAATRAGRRLELIVPRLGRRAYPAGFFRHLSPWLASEPVELTVAQDPELPLPALVHSTQEEGQPSAAEAIAFRAAAAQLAAQPAMRQSRHLEVAVTKLTASSSWSLSPSAWWAEGREQSSGEEEEGRAARITELPLRAESRGAALGTEHDDAEQDQLFGEPSTKADSAGTLRLAPTHSELGVAVHAALAAVLGGERKANWRPALTAAVQRALSALGLASCTEAAQAIDADLSRFLHGPIGRALLGRTPSELRLEWPVEWATVVGASRGQMRGKADLLAQAGDHLWIVDFKYARRHGDVLAHRRQIDAYALALQGDPSQDALGTIVYLREPDGGCVSHQASVARQADIAARMSALLAAI